DRAGERKRRLVFRSDRSAKVHAADYAAEQADSERVGQVDVAFSNKPCVEVELALAGRAFAVGEVGFPRHFELKAQLVTSCGNGLDRFYVIEVPADVVVGIAEFAVLNIKGVASVVAALGQQHAFRAFLGDLHVSGDTVMAVQYVDGGVYRHALGVGVKHVRCAVDRDLRALVGKSQSAARIDWHDLVFACLDVPHGNHLDQFRAILRGYVVIFREIF